ncbi:hypothetical protein [Qipengyuania nanhaisediminis]|uniref:hypothetical protein n=1 Tax=Qipengyuania nanhaisediminis TaxID=604088 RepID=UPI0038B411D2
MSLKSPNYRRAACAAIAIMCAGLLPACSVIEPFAINAKRADNAPAPARVALALPGEDEPEQRRAFAAALVAAFADADIAADPAARLVADYGIAQGPASAGIERAEPARTGETRDWIDPPRKGRRFDECKAQQLRASLMLVDRSTGEMVYRGTGSATQCDFDASHYATIARGLVADYLER